MMAVATDRKDIPQKQAFGFNVFFWVMPALQIIGLLLLSLLFSVLAEWVGMTWVWSDQGARHSERMLMREIGFLSDHFDYRFLSTSPAESALAVSNQAFDTLVVNSGFIGLHKKMMQPPLLSDASLMKNLKRAWQYASDYIVSAINITRVFFVRLAVILWCLPLFGLVAIVAFLDGLVQRELRTYGGDREHPLVQRWVKPYIKPGLFITAFIYLAIPFSIHPNWIFIPSALLTGVLIYITTANYMKRL